MTKKKKEIKDMIKEIEYHKDAIGEHRDKLRDILEDLSSVVYSLDEGTCELEFAIDVLSQNL